MSKLLLILVLVVGSGWTHAEPRDRGGDRRTHRPGSHFRQAEIESLISKLCKEIAAYRTACSGISDFSNFSYDLQNFDNTLRNVKSGLGRGFEACSPDLKRAIRDYDSLDQSFQSTLSTHANYRVRLGWSRVRTAYMKFNFAATGGRGLP
jgi:hypothetical protein